MDISSMGRCCASTSAVLFNRKTPASFKNLLLAVAIAASAHALPVTGQEPDWGQGGTLHIDRSIDSSQNIDLNSPLTLNIDADHAVSLRGQVSGPVAGLNSLIKDGAGRLELWGDNTGIRRYVSLREGTLHLGTRHAVGMDLDAGIYIQPGTTLSYAPDTIIPATLILQDDPGHNPVPIHWRVDHGTATHIADILGTTPMIKTGAGTLRLLNANNLPQSSLMIAEGTVQLGSLFAGHVGILNTATLSGTGHAGTLTVGTGGTLVPLGTMTVGDTLRFEPGGQLHIRAWADGRHDSVHVLLGSAELDGHVIVLPQGLADDWKHGVDAVIVQTRDGLNGSRFASVTSALPYLEPELRYDTHQVNLVLQPRRNIAAATVPPALSAGWAATLRNMLADDSRFIRDAVYTRATSDEHDTAFRFWSHAFYSSADYRGSRHTAGVQRRIQGLLMGADRDISPTWRLGIYGGGSRTQADASHNAIGQDFAASHPGTTPGDSAAGRVPRPGATIDSAHLGLYADHTTLWGSRLTTGVAHSWHRLRSHRTAATPVFTDSLRSRYRARTTQAFAQLQHPLWESADADTRITPFARLAWVHTRQQAHTESGGPLAMQLPSDTTAVLFSTIGLSARHQLMLPQGNAIVTADIAWRHASGDTQAALRHQFRDDVHRTSLASQGIPVAQHAWQLRLGLDAEIDKRTQVRLHYAGQYGQRLQDHGIQVGLTVRW